MYDTDSREPLSPAQAHELSWGPASALHALPEGDDELAAEVERLSAQALVRGVLLDRLAREHGAAVEAAWIRQRPGTRPWCYYAYTGLAELRGGALREARRASVDDSGMALPEPGLLRAHAVLSPAERRRLRAHHYRRVLARRDLFGSRMPPPLVHELPAVVADHAEGLRLLGDLRRHPERQGPRFLENEERRRQGLRELARRVGEHVEVTWTPKDDADRELDRLAAEHERGEA